MGKRVLMVVLAALFAFSAIVFAACSHVHSLDEVAATEATCTQEGNIAHYKCSECGELFSDAEGKTPLSEADVVIGMKAHTFEYTYDDDEHTKTCTACDLTVTEPHAGKAIEGRNVGHIYKSVCDCGYVVEYEDIPVISINTDGRVEITGDMHNAEYFDCTVSVSGCDEEYKLTDAVGRVKVRGNYSANYDKKPYKIKFDDKQVMLGVNEDLKAKEWVLLADYKDKSLLRNPTAQYLASELLGEDGYYSADSRYVEVEVNGTYRGLYLLTEQQEVREERVNVPEPEDPDDYKKGSAEWEAAMNEIHTGYFVEMDAYADSEVALERFYITYRNGCKYADGNNTTRTLMSKYAIKSKVYSQAQNDFIKKVIENTYAVLADAVYNDHTDLAADPYLRLDGDGNIIEDTSLKTEMEAVEASLALDSLVDTFILNEICMDMDVGWSSFLMSIDMSEEGEKKLRFEAPWDWDSSLGFDVDETDGIYTCMPYKGNSVSGTPKGHDNPWLNLLSSKQWFRDEVAVRWGELDERGVFDESIKRLDELSTVYKAKIDTNFDLWARCFGVAEGNSEYNAIRTQEAAKEHLKDFLEARYEFLRSIFVVGDDWI